MLPTIEHRISLELAARPAQVAAAIEVLPEEVLVASTGIIGHLMPMEKVEAGIRELNMGELHLLDVDGNPVK